MICMTTMISITKITFFVKKADGKLHKNQILPLNGHKNRPQPELCPAWGGAALKGGRFNFCREGQG